MEQAPKFSQVIKNPGFSNLWINQILVQLSYNSLNFALIIWVYRLTGSNTAVSMLLFSVYLPAVLLGLFAGVMVDIIDRKKIIITIDFFMSLLFISLVFLKDYYPAILITAFLLNSLAQFYTPAESSAIPLLVKKKELLQANSLFITTLFLSFLVGYGLAGPAIAFLGINFVFIIGAILLFISFILANRFPSITTKPNKLALTLLDAIKNRKAWEFREVVRLEIGQTLSMVRGKLSVMASILILAGVQVVIGVVGVLIPAYLERVIQISATDASYVIISPLGVGMILGALTIGRLGNKIPRRKLVGSGIAVAGLILFLIGVAPLISPAIQHFPKPKPLPFFHQPSLSLMLGISSFLLGTALVSIMIPTQTVLQESSPKEDRGKVFSVLAVAMSALSLIPVLFSGILADIFGTTPIFIFMGGVIAILGLFTLKPDFFFAEHHLPHKFRQFLGLGHWGGA